MKGEDFKLGMRVRIGKGRNLWRVTRIETANGGGALEAGTVGMVALVADERPDHGVNGGSNRGAFRDLYMADFHRVTPVLREKEGVGTEFTPGHSMNVGRPKEGMTVEEKVIYILRSTLRDLPNDAAMTSIAKMVVEAVVEEQMEREVNNLNRQSAGLNAKIAELEEMVLVLATDIANESFGAGADPALYVDGARERVANGETA